MCHTNPHATLAAAGGTNSAYSYSLYHSTCIYTYGIATSYIIVHIHIRIHNIVDWLVNTCALVPNHIHGIV